MSLKSGTIVLSENSSHNILMRLGFIADQTVKPDRVVIVDNNSSDDTVKIIDDWITHNKGINALRVSTPFPNHIHAINAGINYLLSNDIDVISLMENNTYFSKNKNEKVIDTFEKHKYVVGFNNNFIDDNGDIHIRRSVGEKSVNDENCFLYNPTFCKAGIMTIKQILNVNMDQYSVYDFMLRLFRVGLIYTHPDIMDYNIKICTIPTDVKNQILESVSK